MANIKSAKKRVRQSEKRRDHNRYYKKSTRSAIKNLRELDDKKKAEEFMPSVVSKIDKLVRMNIWHQNKANNLKSKLMKHVNSL